jgi:hypothetical protein
MNLREASECHRAALGTMKYAEASNVTLSEIASRRRLAQ